MRRGWKRVDRERAGEVDTWVAQAGMYQIWVAHTYKAAPGFHDEWSFAVFPPNDDVAVEGMHWEDNPVYGSRTAAKRAAIAKLRAIVEPVVRALEDLESHLPKPRRGKSAP